jgi:hypothetical protein
MYILYIMANLLSEMCDTFKNLEQNGKISLAMTSITNEVGEVYELAVATAAESNICDVYKGSFNHLKIAHAKKSLVCNYVKGATAAEDTIIYDVVINYNNTNSTTSPTVLCSINVSDFVSISDAARATAVTGVLANSTDLDVDWDNKLKTYKNLSTYLTKHNTFHNSIKQALAASKPFGQ